MSKYDDEFSNDHGFGYHAGKFILKKGAYGIGKMVEVNAAGMPAAPFANLLGKAPAPIVGGLFNFAERREQGRNMADAGVAALIDTFNPIYGIAKLGIAATDNIDAPNVLAVEREFEEINRNTPFSPYLEQDPGDNPIGEVRAMRDMAKGVAYVHNKVVDAAIALKNAPSPLEVAKLLVGMRGHQRAGAESPAPISAKSSSGGNVNITVNIQNRLSKLNLNEVVLSKVFNMLNGKSSSEQEKLIKLFEQQHAKNSQKLSELEKKLDFNSQGIAEIYEQVGAIYKEMQVAKSHAAAMANFQGVMDGFNLLANIGYQTNNRSLQMIGSTGVAITQAVLGCAQLTGSLGLTAVTGLAMVTPITAIIGAVFAIATTLFGRGRAKKQARAAQRQAEMLQKALQAISEQIVNLHKAMIKGFDVVIENLDNIRNLIHESMAHLNHQLNEILYHEHIIEYKLDSVLADIQKLSLQINKQRLLKLNEYTHRLLLNGEVNTQTVLAKLHEELKFSHSDEIKNIDYRGNNVEGWYYIGRLSVLIAKPEFSEFNLSLEDVPNFKWWSFVVSNGFNMLPHLKKKNEEVINSCDELCDSVTRSSTALENLLSVLSDEKFLRTFLSYYETQLNTVKAKADTLLREYRENYSLAAQSKKVKDLIQLNKSNGSKDLTYVFNTIAESSATEMANSTVSRRILEQVEAYNKIVKEFKLLSETIFSLVDIKSPIKDKISGLAEIDLGYYTKYSVHSCKDPSGATFSYLAGPEQSLLAGFSSSEQEVTDLVSQYADKTEAVTARLVNTRISAMFSKLSAVVQSVDSHCCPEEDVLSTLGLRV